MILFNFRRSIYFLWVCLLHCGYDSSGVRNEKLIFLFFSFFLFVFGDVFVPEGIFIKTKIKKNYRFAFGTLSIYERAILFLYQNQVK